MNILFFAFLIFPFKLITKVNAYCGTTTTPIDFTRTLVSTKGEINNQISTITREFVQATTFFVTTLQMDTCKTINDATQNFGQQDYLSSQPEQFSIQFSDLNYMTVYSQQYVNAFAFNYANGNLETYGKPIGDATVIDLQNKDVVAINVHSFYWIYSIQFLIYDKQQNTYSWTNNLGLPGGNYYSINADQVRHASQFKLTSISGTADGFIVNQIHFTFSYDVCNPFVTGPTIPTIPPTTTITTTAPTSFSTITTTIAYGYCKILHGQSDLLGKTGTDFFKMIYNVSISDLKAIEIYSGDIVYGIKFTLKDFSSVFVGNYVSKKIKKIKIIDLQNKQLAAVHIRAGFWINSIQFLIYDSSNNTFYWTAELGGMGGNPSYIDGVNVAPLSTNFQIASISATGDPTQLRTLLVSYSYKQCNPPVATTLTPPAPKSFPTTIFSTEQTTFNLKNVQTSVHN